MNKIERCLDHRLKSMTNIRSKHVLCEIHDISHVKNTKCRKCRLNIDNYNYTLRYTKKKIYENFYNELTKNSNKNINDILNNSKDTKVVKFKKIYEKRNKKSKKKKDEMIYKQSCHKYYDHEIYDNKNNRELKKIVK